MRPRLSRESAGLIRCEALSEKQYDHTRNRPECRHLLLVWVIQLVIRHLAYPIVNGAGAAIYAVINPNWYYRKALSEGATPNSSASISIAVSMAHAMRALPSCFLIFFAVCV